MQFDVQEIASIHRYDIPIGLEESVLDIGHRHFDFETAMPPEFWRAKHSGKEHKSAALPFSENLITVNIVDGNIRQVMERVVPQMGNYEWEIKDEVVNIFPVRGRDERIEGLMGLEIPVFYVGAGAKTSAVQAQLLLFLPEIKQFLKKNGLEADTTRFSPGFPDELASRDINFKNIKFRDLLNSVTRIKRGGWIVRLARDPKDPKKELLNIQVD
jgi:hypothetical protein